MERVDAEPRIGAPLGDDIRDPLRAVRRDDGDLLAARFTEKVKEAPQRLLVPPDSRPDEAARIVVDADCQVAVVTLVADLVDADAAQPLEGIMCRSPVGDNAGDD